MVYTTQINVLAKTSVIIMACRSSYFFSLFVVQVILLGKKRLINKNHITINTTNVMAVIIQFIE